MYSASKLEAEGCLSADKLCVQETIITPHSLSLSPAIHSVGEQKQESRPETLLLSVNKKSSALPQQSSITNNINIIDVEPKLEQFPSAVIKSPIHRSDKNNHIDIGVMRMTDSQNTYFPMASKIFRDDQDEMKYQIEGKTISPLASPQIRQSRELVLQSPFHCTTKETPSKVLYLNSKVDKGALIVSDKINTLNAVKSFNANQTVIVSSLEKQNSLKINIPKSLSVSKSTDSLLLDKNNPIGVSFVPDVSINPPVSTAIKSILIASTLPDIRQLDPIVVASSNKLTVSRQAYSCKTNTTTTTCIVNTAVSSSTKKSASSSSFEKPNSCFNIRTSLPNVTKSLQNTCIAQPFNYHTPVKTVAMPSGPCAATTQVTSPCKRQV